MPFRLVTRGTLLLNNAFTLSARANVAYGPKDRFSQFNPTPNPLNPYTVWSKPLRAPVGRSLMSQSRDAAL